MNAVLREAPDRPATQTTSLPGEETKSQGSEPVQGPGRSAQLPAQVGPGPKCLPSLPAIPLKWGLSRTHQKRLQSSEAGRKKTPKKDKVHQ